MSVDAYAGIDPARKRCCAVGEVDADSVVEALRDGLIVVPVSVETARQIWGSEPVDIYAIALGGSASPAITGGLNEEQIVKVRELVQIVANDDGTDFDTAFSVSMKILKLHAIDNASKGKASGGEKPQAVSSHADHFSD